MTYALVPTSPILTTPVLAHAQQPKNSLNKVLNSLQNCFAALTNCFTKKKVIVVPRPEFAKNYCILTPREASDKSSVRELHELIVDLGLKEQLKCEIIEGGERPQIRFHHSSQEIRCLANLFEDLQPYFFRGEADCFFRDNGPICPSDKGLFEEPATKKLLLRSLAKKTERELMLLTARPIPVECTVRKDVLSSDVGILRDIYVRQKFNGLCVGERHGQKSSKQFLIDNFEALSGLGVKILFTEFFNYDTMQPYLDDYFASESDEMHPLLEAVLTDADDTYGFTAPYSYRELVRAAKAAGIRIVGIDTSLSYDLGNFENTLEGDERIKAMNSVAQKIIRYEASRSGGKYIVHLGGAHGPTLEADSGYAVPGLADLLQCPFIMVQDDEKDEFHAEANVTDLPYSSFRKKHIHLLLKKPKKAVISL